MCAATYKLGVCCRRVSSTRLVCVNSCFNQWSPADQNNSVENSSIQWNKHTIILKHLHLPSRTTWTQIYLTSPALKTPIFNYTKHSQNSIYIYLAKIPSNKTKKMQIPKT